MDSWTDRQTGRQADETAVERGENEAACEAERGRQEWLGRRRGARERDTRRPAPPAPPAPPGGPQLPRKRHSERSRPCDRHSLEVPLRWPRSARTPQARPERPSLSWAPASGTPGPASRWKPAGPTRAQAATRAGGRTGVATNSLNQKMPDLAFLTETFFKKFFFFLKAGKQRNRKKGMKRVPR